MNIVGISKTGEPTVDVEVLQHVWETEEMTHITIKEIFGEERTVEEPNYLRLGDIITKYHEGPDVSKLITSCGIYGNGESYIPSSHYLHITIICGKSTNLYWDGVVIDTKGIEHKYHVYLGTRWSVMLEKCGIYVPDGSVLMYGTRVISNMSEMVNVDGTVELKVV